MTNLVFALKAEATPFIEKYSLRACTPKGLFTVYEGENISLIISGIGKTASAAAVGYLYRLQNETHNQVWLNIGIAGHPDLSVGQLCVADKITDFGTHRSWYPPQITRHGIQTLALTTYDKPNTGYADNTLCDMEASGFYEFASRCATSEIVQSIKIVSDNRNQPASLKKNKIDQKTVSELIGNHVNTIEQYIKSINDIAEKLRALDLPPDLIEGFTDRWHFTISQKHKLLALLQRQRALTPKRSLWQPDLEACKNSKDVLVLLQRHLDILAAKF